VLDLSFQERFYLVECINKKNEDTKRAVEAMQAKNNKK